MDNAKFARLVRRVCVKADTIRRRADGGDDAASEMMDVAAELLSRAKAREYTFAGHLHVSGLVCEITDELEKRVTRVFGSRVAAVYISRGRDGRAFFRLPRNDGRMASPPWTPGDPAYWVHPVGDDGPPPAVAKFEVILTSDKDMPTPEFVAAYLVIA